jgi:enoyl-CoA hydratase
MIQTRLHQDILTLELARGRGNSLSIEFLHAIAAALEQARRDRPRGLVITASGRTFCAGFDLQAALSHDRRQVRALLDALYGVVHSLFAFPRPVVAALNGHTIAGGAILSLACDVRVMSGGEGKWGLNEIALGISVPGFAVEVARYALPRPVLERVLYAGRLYPGYKAYDMGILDLVPDDGELEAMARRAVERWTPSVDAFADIKARLHAPTLAAMEVARSADDAWLDLWFSDEAQHRITAALEALRNK